MWSKIGSFQCQLRRIVLINLGILIGLYLSGEIALHIVSPNSNPFLGINVLRIRDPVYHHTLTPKYDGFDLWGPHRFRILSNSLGFRDASTRDVPLVADRKRVVFIGDSFTEGIGLPYEETFVGRFARAFPELDVLNAAVFSYSPSIYYKKKANIFWTSGLGSTRPSPTSIFPTYEMKLGFISMTSMACCKGRGGVRRKKRGGKRRFMPPTPSMN